MIHRTLLCFMAVGAICSSEAPVSAELLEFEISGVITDPVEDPNLDFPQIGPGDAFTGSFRFDTDWPELDGGADPTYGVYLLLPPVVPLEFRVADLTFAANPDWPTDIFTSNDAPDEDLGPFDEFAMFAPASQDQPAAIPPDGFAGYPVEFGMILNTSNTQVLSDTSLPHDFRVEDWETRIVFFKATTQVEGQFVYLEGGIENIQAVRSLPILQAGDADQDLDFDQLDLVRVQVTAKYRTGQPASWGEGDWDGAPGGHVDEPPPGNGLFDQFDIIAAQQAGLYLAGPYAADGPKGRRSDGQASIVYDARTGRLAVDAPPGIELTSLNVDSAAGIFTSEAARNLRGSFDIDADANIFKAVFGGSFGSLDFGNVAQAGLTKQYLLNDLSIVGSLKGGGGLGEVDLIYIPVPEPISLVLALLGCVLLRLLRRRIAHSS